MPTEVQWSPASGVGDLVFARGLARRTMEPYYTHHGLMWRDEDFDAGWHCEKTTAYMWLANR
ncbi:hypothetical protein [Pseudomonas typographi]|uniref:hypothetical protein n=1 Tax=Pseudomonas typographi TaxID=2715964 RepID=UPI001EEE2D6E|nr:hypothetical protein [Pseudomonas typographi]